MLTIRLQRTGTKNKASFRIVLAQSYRSASKQVLEVLGHFNPKTKLFGIKDQNRLQYWLSQQVSVSPTVRNLLVEKKLVEGKKVKAWRPKVKPQTEVTGSQAKPAQPVASAEPPAAVEAPVPQAAVEPTPTSAAPSVGVEQKA